MSSAAKNTPKKAPRKAPVQVSRKSAKKGSDSWTLRLYVAGQTPKSLTAIANLKRICQEHMELPYEIDVIDLMANPHLAAGDQILAIPTLVRRLPEPVRKIIGDLSNMDRVLVALDIDKQTA